MTGWNRVACRCGMAQVVEADTQTAKLGVSQPFLRGRFLADMGNRVRNCRMLDKQHQRDQQQREKLAQFHGFSRNSRDSVASARENSQAPLFGGSGTRSKGSRRRLSWLKLWRKLQ